MKSIYSHILSQDLKRPQFSEALSAAIHYRNTVSKLADSAFFWILIHILRCQGLADLAEVSLI